MIANATSPRIYVACLSAYNNGRLHGAWIDADTDADTIMDEVQTMLAASPEPGAEEWAIHDYDGFESIRVSESQDFETVASWAHGIAEHGAAYAAWADNDSHNIAVSDFEEAYQGEWDSLADFAFSWLEDTDALAGMPEDLRPYFDYDAYARDMNYNGDVWTAESPSYGVFVFLNL